MNIRQFNHSPHPYWLPNFMNVFAWSIPFVAEKVAEMLLEIFDGGGEEESEKGQEALEHEKEKRAQQLRAKIRLVSKFMRMYSTLRSERESILLLKGLSERNTIPKGLLTAGASAIREAIGDFMKAKAADRNNEMRPISPIPTGRNINGEPNLKLRELQRKNLSSHSLTNLLDTALHKDSPRSSPIINESSYIVDDTSSKSIFNSSPIPKSTSSSSVPSPPPATLISHLSKSDNIVGLKSKSVA